MALGREVFFFFSGPAGGWLAGVGWLVLAGGTHEKSFFTRVYTSLVISMLFCCFSFPPLVALLFTFSILAFQAEKGLGFYHVAGRRTTSKSKTKGEKEGVHDWEDCLPP